MDSQSRQNTSFLSHFFHKKFSKKWFLNFYDKKKICFLNLILCFNQHKNAFLASQVSFQAFSMILERLKWWTQQLASKVLIYFVWHGKFSGNKIPSIKIIFSCLASLIIYWCFTKFVIQTIYIVFNIIMNILDDTKMQGLCSQV